MIWRGEKDYIYYKYILIDIYHKYILINQLSYKNSNLICIRIQLSYKSIRNQLSYKNSTLICIRIVYEKSLR